MTTESLQEIEEKAQDNKEGSGSMKGTVIFAAGALPSVIVHFTLLPLSPGVLFLQFFSVLGCGLLVNQLLKKSAKIARLGWFLVFFLMLVVWGMMFFHLLGITVLSFSTAWLIGWNRQQRKKHQNAKAGNIIGGVFVVVGLLVTFANLMSILPITRFRNLAPSEVASIEFQQSDGETRAVVEDQHAVAAIIGKLKYTYPYYANHERIEDYKPLLMKIKLRSRGEWRFVIGAGNSANSGAVYLNFAQGYQNIPLREALQQNVPELKDW